MLAQRSHIYLLASALRSLGGGERMDFLYAVTPIDISPHFLRVGLMTTSTS